MDKEIFLETGEDTYFAGKLDELSYWVFHMESIAEFKNFLDTKCFKPQRVNDHFIVTTKLGDHFSVDFWISKDDIKMFFKNDFIELPDLMLSKKVRKALAAVVFDYLDGVKLTKDDFEKNTPYSTIIIQ